MDNMDKAIEDAAMEKLEREQRGLHDAYNTLTDKENENDYRHLINTPNHQDYAIRKGEKLQIYATRLQEHIEFANKKNYKIHVIIGTRGHPWYTHKSANGCFMCEDTSFLLYLLSIIKALATLTPNLILLP